MILPEIRMNDSVFFVERHVASGSDPLEIRIKVYMKNQREEPLVELVTLIEDRV